jgi:hypothetical protein
MAIFIARYGVNVPFWDQWELVPLLEKYENGTLGFSDVWAQHNEHRIVFPKLIMIGLARLSGWNILYELYTSFILACLIYLFIFLLLKGASDLINRNVYIGSSLFFSWMVFSTAQYANWLTGWQLQWFLNVLALLVAVWALTSWPGNLPGWQGLLVGTCAAIVGTYSLSAGLLIWAVGGVILFVQEGFRRRFFIWTAFALITATTYFVNYTKLPGYPSWLDSIGRPGKYIQYVLVYLGASLAEYLEGSPSLFLLRVEVIGLSLLGLFITATAYLVSSHLTLFKRSVGWFAVGFYALSAAAVTGLGRAGGVGFIGQAAESRYTTISVLFVMSTLVIISVASTAYVRHRQLGRRHVMVLSSGGALLIILFVLNYLQGVQSMSLHHSYMLKAKRCLEYLDAPDPCLTLVYPNGTGVLEKTAFLRKRGWGGLKPLPILRSAKVIKPAQKAGWVDKVTLKESDGTVEVSGWAHYTEKGFKGNTVILISRGRILTEAPVGSDRPDVARSFSSDRLSEVGLEDHLSCFQAGKRGEYHHRLPRHG